MEKMTYSKHNYWVPSDVWLASDLSQVSGVRDLPKLGCGHDGAVFKYGDDKALKLLKYGIEGRKDKSLMTFEKCLYFVDELNGLKRIVTPCDILLDSSGVYTGYVMHLLDDVTLDSKKGTAYYKKIGDFTCGDLALAVNELAEDFNLLSKKRVVAADLNRGSMIITRRFLELCDTDKYEISCKDLSKIENENANSNRYVIARFLGDEMIKMGASNKEVSRWVKTFTNDVYAFDRLNKELNMIGDNCPIEEMIGFKTNSLGRRR